MPKKGAVRTWAVKPNWYLYYFNDTVACWYSPTKAMAITMANAYVNARKSNNKLNKVKVYKKDFTLTQMAKGENDA